MKESDVYTNPALPAAVSPTLRRRVHGKACFNFTTVDREWLEELAALTTHGIPSFGSVKLPLEDATPK